MITNTTAHDLNEWIRLIAQRYDVMNDYYPGTLWLDTDSGTFGDARTLVLIDTTEWSAEDNDAWECMTDSERNGYGVDYVETRGTSVGPLNTNARLVAITDRSPVAVGRGGSIRNGDYLTVR